MLFKILRFVLQVTEGDEMSEKHYREACTMAYGRAIWTIVLFGMIGALMRMFNIVLLADWYGWILMVIGVMEVRAGLSFYRLEKNGE